jgi:DUF1365 family protein
VSELASCLYVGEVVHQRFAPTHHRLRYRMFQMLFDLDELPNLHRRFRLFSHNRFNVLAFRDTDHGLGSSGSLRTYVETLLAQAGISGDCGPIRLLCMPRIFGHNFNPLSIYYCHDRSNALVAMIYEVSNTFGERHSYLIATTSPDGSVVRQSCDKGFYVSPFMDLEMRYDFRMTTAAETIATAVTGSRSDGAPLIFAAFTGRRRELSDVSLLRVLLAYPFLTLGVVAAIHWEALKLFVKGLRIRQRTPVGRAGLTVVDERPRAPAPTA